MISVVALAAGLVPGLAGVEVDHAGRSHAIHLGVTEPELRTATTHPMQYYLSLPDGWTPDKHWTVVVAFDGSGKDWLDLTHIFIDARKAMPFIIVVPLILTNGGDDLRTHPNYHYSSAVWDAVDTNGKCGFDLDGVTAVLADVERTSAGETRAFVTGFSAGAHLMWAIAFQHPERLAAAVTSSGNYVGRCVDEETISSSPARVDLPILGIGGSSDPGGPVFEKQFNMAKELAARHGYANISYRFVPGEHDPHAEAVLAYFMQLRSGG